MDRERPDPQQLLQTIQEQENHAVWGKLKIFFGYAAGVGKTYAMLKAAHYAQREGKDVVVGYVERHTRPDTLALLDGLEQLPCREVAYKGVILKEFDLDAALQRKPQLILVDELAHSNAAGCRHRKRYQDVEELLRAGIDVYTTVNVQHLESLNDLVASITGIAVSERVPDRVFDAADQVKLVDIEPAELMNRLQEGKVYKQGQAQRALHNFFSLENLAALREIALRRTADRLNRTAQKEGREAAARAGEHILICLSGSPSNARVIRTAARMAEAFHSGFTALLVETPETKELKGDSARRLQDNLHLAEQMGAQISTVYGDDPAAEIAEYAKVSGITKIVMGRTNHKQNLLLGRKNLADKLTALTENIDIYIIPDTQPLYKRKLSLFRYGENRLCWQDMLKTLFIAAVSTVVGYLFYRAGLRDANIITIYILGVLVTSIWTQGYLYGALASLISVISFNFFFTVPQFSFEAAAPDYPVTFIIMLVSSIITSTLATRVKKQARLAAQKAYSTELLMNTNLKLQQGKDEQEVIRILAEQLNKLLERPVLYALEKGENTLHFSVFPPEKETEVLCAMSKEEYGVADWVAKNNKRAGATTGTLADADNLFLSVRGVQGVMGIVGIPVKKYPLLEIFEKNMMISMLNECGIILERIRLRSFM